MKTTKARTSGRSRSPWSSPAQSAGGRARGLPNCAASSSNAAPRWTYDPVREEIVWSAEACRRAGIAPGRLAGSAFASRLGADGWARLQAALIDAGRAKHPVDQHFRFATAEAGVEWIRFTGAPIESADGLALGGVAEILKTPLRSVKEGEPDHDSLTGLADRQVLHRTLLRLCSESSRLAVLRVTIEGFKAVNEVHGTGAGDAVLRDVASALVAAGRGGDLAARTGSHEFALLALGVEAEDEAMARAHLVRELLKPLPGCHPALPEITVSAGISVAPLHTSGADELMTYAGLALDAARRDGTNCTVMFRAGLKEALNVKQRQRSELREALMAGQLEVFYQPIVDLRTSIVRGWEALLRWRHPQRGLLTPGSFLIGLADEALAMEIDRFVLQRGLAQMRSWIDAGVPVTCVGVNTSAHQLRRADFVDEIGRMLEETRLTPDRLKLEVLETAFFGDRVDIVANTIAGLSRLGIVCSLDDFGTGYASLTHLKTFKVERLKIDMSFIKNILSNPFDRAITQSVIDLGRNLEMRVTAEGIETLEQLRLLRSFGCDCGQGYLFGRPMPADSVPEALASWYGGGAARLLGAAGAAA